MHACLAHSLLHLWVPGSIPSVHARRRKKELLTESARLESEGEQKCCVVLGKT